MTKTQIANIALAKFREGRITNLESDTDPVAVVMNDQYDHALELLLEEHRWNFACKRVTLTKLSEDPPFGWDNQYQLPSDIIRVRDVNGEDVEASSQLFTIEGDKLLTNDDTVTITYTGKVTDVNLFSPSFIESLAFKLASITCGRLTGDTDLSIALDKQYNYALSKAAHNDAKANGSRDKNLMRRLLDGSALTGGGASYPRSSTSGSSASSGSVAAHKHELTDLLKTDAVDGQVIAWNDAEGEWQATDSGTGDVATDTIFDAAGDLVVGTGADTATRLPLGANGLVLKSNGTTVEWDAIAGTGDVVGDASSTDNAITRFDGVTGKAIQNSVVTIDDTGNIATAGTVDGRDVSVDGTKLDTIETNADVTDTANVTAAGALMDSEVTNLAQVKAFDTTDYAPALGVDDNYVTDAEKVVIGNTSGTNTGDEVEASVTIKGIVEIATQTEINNGLAADDTKAISPWYLKNSDYYTDRIANNAKLTADETNVVAALDGATLTDAGVPASDDKVLIQDTSDSNNLKYVDISDLPSGGGGGNVTKVGTPVDNQVGVWTGDGTIEGTTGLTYDGSALDITGNVTVSGTVDGRDVALDGTAIDGNVDYLPRVLSTTAKTAGFTAVIGETHYIDTSLSGFTATLPAIASGQGRIAFYFTGTGNSLTVDPNASETIDGKTTIKLDHGHNTIENDGTEWKLIQRSGISPNRLDPAQITANQDGYNPTDWTHGVTHLYIDSDASREIQGFEEDGFHDMEQVVVTNDGANDIVIKHDTATTVANRVLVDGNADFTLGANQTGILMRDGTANKWRFYGINNVGGGTANTDMGLAVSDETTALTGSTTTPLGTFHAQNAGTWSEILIGVTTAPTGSTLTCDVHKNGTTIFSTKPTIDAGEKTSVTAATAAVLSTTTYAKGDLIELFCDSVGATVAGTGLKFYFNQS